MTLTPAEFKQQLEHGPYAWPGGYPRYAVLSDGEALCFPCCKVEQKLILEACADPSYRTGWEVEAVDVNWEDTDLVCVHCNKPIESAYGDDAE